MRRHRAAAGAVRVRRGLGWGIPGRWVGVLGVLWFALAGGSCGGGEDTGAGVVPPVLPPPRPPPPLTDTLFVGFAEDRIEITEGEAITVGVEFEPYYRTPRDPKDPSHRWAAYVRAVVEPGSGSEADLLVGGAQIGRHRQILDAGTTWLAIRARLDGVLEGTESLKLRLEPFLPHFVVSYPPAVEVRSPELEVVIRDAEGSGVCRDTRITGTAPRNVSWPHPGPPRCRFGDVFETEVTVESERGQGLQLDRITPSGRIDGWRVEAEGSRVRHHLVLQWAVEEDGSWDMRLEPCPLTGRGPMLVCDIRACESYAPGEPVPVARRPAGCRD